MFKLSEKIFALLNVASITDVATGGVWPLLAEQEVKEFITYRLEFADGITKDGRNGWVVIVQCFSGDYDNALKMQDEVSAVMEGQRNYLRNLDSKITEEYACVTIGTYSIKI